MLKMVERLQPTDNKVQMKIGIILEKKERYEEALQTYRRILYFNPRNLEAKAAVGRVNMAQGDFMGAVIAYQELTRLAPNNAEVYYNLGLAFQGKGRKNEARDALKQAYQLYQSQGNTQGMEQVRMALDKL
jgi:Flp pilus assembly protein TadD